MMMSMAGKKGSIAFGRNRRDIALQAPLASSMLRCVRPLRIETAGAGIIRAREVKWRFGGGGLVWSYL
jgi:hypothetical protein